MFRKLLVVVDMQKDFIDGALGTAEAVKIVPAVCEKSETLTAISSSQRILIPESTWILRRAGSCLFLTA